MASFWENYYTKPLELIPWQHVQSDWFKDLLTQEELEGKTALDLGCGTGMKSIDLAHHHFNKIIGIDISSKAIEYANMNAIENDVQDICHFKTGDIAASHWNFINAEDRFDVIVDWAAIHCLPKVSLPSYAKNITAHCNDGGIYLVRFFSSEKQETSFEEIVDHSQTDILLLQIDNFKELFPEFSILKQHQSKPSPGKQKKGYFFIELLMKKNTYS